MRLRFLQEGLAPFLEERNGGFLFALDCIRVCRLCLSRKHLFIVKSLAAKQEAQVAFAQLDELPVAEKC